MPFPKQVGVSQFTEDLNRTKGRGRANSFSVCLTGGAGTSRLIFSHPWVGAYTIQSPGSQDFGFRLESQHWLLWIYNWQKADHRATQPPSLREPVSHNKSPCVCVCVCVFVCVYNRINIYFIYIYMHISMSSVSLENAD